MSDNQANYTNIDNNEGLMYQTFDSLENRLVKSKDSIDSFFDGIDGRILRYKADTFGKLVDKMDDLVDDQTDLRSGQDYYNSAYQGYRAAKRAVSDINTATTSNLGDIVTPGITNSVNAINAVNRNLEENKTNSRTDHNQTQDVEKRELDEYDKDTKNKTKRDVTDPEELKLEALVTNNNNNKRNDNVSVSKKVLDNISTLDNQSEENSDNSLNASVLDGFKTAGQDIIDAIENGPARLRKQISPYSGNVGVTGHMNKATAGIIAAASVAAGGAATGGGLLVSKKLSITRFTPEDWMALGPDYQTVIEQLLRKVGFSSEEVELFKTSNFKIATAELQEHIKKINKAIANNPTFGDDLLKLYDFSMVDDNNKVIDYLLFITMIIDGRNSIDEYNMYSVINQALETPEDAEFFYTGIEMEDYIDDSEDEEDIKILNDPTTKEETSTEEEPIEEEKEEEKTEETEDTPEEDLEKKSPFETKEWLKGIGMED